MHASSKASFYGVDNKWGEREKGGGGISFVRVPKGIGRGVAGLRESSNA